MALVEANKELIWLKSFLDEHSNKQADCPLFYGSQSLINLTKNLVFHAKTKHIKLRYHLIRYYVTEKTLKLIEDKRDQEFR